MIPSGSRYQQAAKEFTECHIYDEYGYPWVEKTGNVYRFVSNSREATYLVTTLPLPPPPPREYYAKDTESYQFLAYKFLKNPLRWWELAEANPQVWYPLDLTMGSYIRVPPT
jgi:hypothetical protein